jgi:hypothetical protein
MADPRFEDRRGSPSPARALNRWVSSALRPRAVAAASRRRLDDLFQSVLHRAFNGEL